MGDRFFTFNSIIRVNQIEMSRKRDEGVDEAVIHTPETVGALREAFEKAWPGGRMTWAFSWRALQDPRPNYEAIRKLVARYVRNYGDEATFEPWGGYANYNRREQVKRDIHDGLALVSALVGGGYRPRSLLACALNAEDQRYLAEEEGIHVCQGNIWSQYSIDDISSEGSVCYPYYPSREHFCKPAQGKEDFIDCVNLDGWTCDFLAARRPGFKDGFNSRLGVGPIETVLTYGTEVGVKEMLATTAVHFDQGFALNNFAWVTDCWEVSLVEGRKIYNYHGRNGLDGLVLWLSEVRRRWPKAMCITQGEFGLAWRERFKDNAKWDYRFVERGSGIGGSDANMEIRWFMNKDFRLALLRDWKKNEPERVIDFTRYDLKAEEPTDLDRDWSTVDRRTQEATREWSLMNRLNQKGVRPQDKPILIGQLTVEEQAFIKRRCPEIFAPTPGGELPPHGALQAPSRKPGE
jgi:hypothetical protein